jgi:hypothetical protein
MVGRIHLRKFEKGQSAVIVALLLLALVGMLALTFDGANGYFQRRLAQTAADAGTLAGTRVLCATGNTASAASTASQYATVYNTALQADVVATNSVVTVTTAITFPTTFGNVLGIAHMTAGATASAGCFVPSGVGTILPIAYSCKAGQIVTVGGVQHCDLVDYNHTYIIMDSQKLASDLTCMSQGGTINCDYNGDGIDDRLIGGDRSWLDLNGNTNGPGGASQMCNWLTNGYTLGVRVNTWFPMSDGTATSVYDCARGLLNKPVFLPVYNIISTSPTPMPGLTPPDQIVWGTGTSRQYVHVISFAVFVITCVNTKNQDHCPVHDGFNLGANVKTIEGYFTTGYVSGVNGVPGGVFAGAYTLYLTH